MASELFQLLRKRAPTPVSAPKETTETTDKLEKAAPAKPAAKPAAKPVAKAAKPAAKPLAKAAPAAAKKVETQPTAKTVTAEKPKLEKAAPKLPMLYSQEELQKIADGIAQLPERDLIAALISFTQNVQDYSRRQTLAKLQKQEGDLLGVTVGPDKLWGESDSGPASMADDEGTPDESEEDSHVEGNVEEGGENSDEESKNAGPVQADATQPSYGEADSGPNSMGDDSGTATPDPMDEVTEAGKSVKAKDLKKAENAALKKSADFRTFVNSFTNDLSKLLAG